MRYFLTGVETNNKGAELMLYAILQEIERHDSDGIVYIEKRNILQGVNYVKTKVKLIVIERTSEKIVNFLRINGILRRLHLPQIEFDYEDIPPIDYVIDGSGLHFTDQMTRAELLPYWKHVFSAAKKYQAKIVFLPQGFGPIEKKTTKEAVKLLFENADIVYAREHVSYDMLNTCGTADVKKVKVSTDFTALVDGVMPERFARLKGGICIVPNMQMVNKGVLTKDSYISYIRSIVDIAKKSGRNVYLLNHEGKADEAFLCECSTKLSSSITIVTGLNALETKGLISSAYIVITSRFHGLASALNSSVPALSTSWSHKYSCLYEDYNIKSGVLTLNNMEEDRRMIEYVLDENNNKIIRERLNASLPNIRIQIKEMWATIWSL